MTDTAVAPAKTTTPTAVESAIAAPPAAPAVTEPKKTAVDQAMAGATEADKSAAEKLTAPPVADTEWRKVYGEDEAVQKIVARYNDPASLAKGLLEKEEFIRKGLHSQLPNAESTPEQIAAFKQAFGVPDTADGYTDLPAPPEGYEMAEGEAEFLKGVTAKLHAKGGLLATPQGIAAAHDAYYELSDMRAAQMIAADDAAGTATLNALKDEWKSSFNSNMALAKAAANKIFDVADVSDIFELQLADGVRLGNYAPFLKAMHAAAAQLGNEQKLLQSLNLDGPGSKSLEDDKAAIMDLMRTDRIRYNSPETQARLDTVNSLLAGRKRTS